MQKLTLLMNKIDVLVTYKTVVRKIILVIAIQNTLSELKNILTDFLIIYVYLN